MAQYNHIIENWWKHLGCYDREQASDFTYEGNSCTYLQITDDWWDSLTFEEKEQVYEEFFNEN